MMQFSNFIWGERNICPDRYWIWGKELGYTPWMVILLIIMDIRFSLTADISLAKSIWWTNPLGLSCGNCPESDTALSIYPTVPGLIKKALLDPNPFRLKSNGVSISNSKSIVVEIVWDLSPNLVWIILFLKFYSNEF